MATPRELPGFYYCSVKKKYFKIESSPTAPANSAYSASNVKKRKLQEDEAAALRERKGRTSRLIKRASILSVPITGGRFGHEIGVYDSELPNKCWLNGLQDKGEVDFGIGPPLECMLINGDDTNSGLGVVYASRFGAHQLTGSYIPTDSNDKINFHADPLHRASRANELHTEPFLTWDISSLCYHRGSNTILQTSTVPPHDPVSGRSQALLTMFNPTLTPPERSDTMYKYRNELGPHPAWLLGETNQTLNVSFPERARFFTASRAQPDAHGNPSHAALVASSIGVMFVNGRDNVAYDGPTRDILSVDWHPTNPHIIFAGDRSGHFYRRDTRAPGGGGGGMSKWETYRHRSSVAHLRAIDDFQVLAAGPESAMAMYDLRWTNPRPKRPAAPVCSMHAYCNTAHVRIGLDVLAPLHGGEGVVAAATSEGKVQVFSLRTGDRLRAGAVDELQAKNQVIKCLQWETMPGEKDPSLWATVGNTVKKYSFGLDEGEDVFP